MSDQITHKAILDAIDELRGDVAPLVAITPQLKSLADIHTAARIGGDGIKWLAAIGAAMIAIGVTIKAFGNWIITP